MALLVPNCGEQRMIEMICNCTTAANAGENLRIRLYSSNTSPTSTQTLADFTEAVFTGYTAFGVTATSSSWTIVAGAPTSATQTAATTWTCSGTTSYAVYGYMLTQLNSSVLMWAERFSDGPYTITNVGDKVILTPALTLSTT